MSEAKARELLQDFVNCGVESEHRKYLTVQVDHATWNAARAYLAAVPAPPAEPVAWMYTSTQQEPYLSLTRCDCIEGEHETPLYAAPAAEPVAQPDLSPQQQVQRASFVPAYAREQLKVVRWPELPDEGNPEDEPVAQQPPPLISEIPIRALIEERLKDPEYAAAYMRAERETEAEIAAAPQPEAPTLADDLVRRLRGKASGQNVGITTHLFDEAAARIESDAEHIRELEADNAGMAQHCGELIDRATKAEALLAASRERERALGKALRLHGAIASQGAKGEG